MATDEPYYYGSAENKLNSKGQVAIPARFRLATPEEDLQRNFVLVRGENDCIYMYTHRHFLRVKNNVKELADEANDIDFYRRFMAEAQPVELDTQGRFVMPAELMKTAGIAGPGILFIGMDDRIEIWDPGKYRSTRGDSGQYEETRRRGARRIFGI